MFSLGNESFSVTVEVSFGLLCDSVAFVVLFSVAGEMLETESSVISLDSFDLSVDWTSLDFASSLVGLKIHTQNKLNALSTRWNHDGRQSMFSIPKYTFPV